MKTLKKAILILLSVFLYILAPVSLVSPGINIAFADPSCSGLGSHVITPQSNPSYFTHQPTASYGCLGTDLNVQFFDQGGAPLGEQVNPIGGPSSNVDQNGNVTNDPTDCDGTVSYLANLPTCMFRTFAAGTGAALMSLTAWLLGIAGLIFDWLVGYTIVNFKTFFDTVSSGVTLGWTAFRDLANILIIGLFVFIAISIILGLKEFGQKKYIARILIIAVLINFSFLLTEMIVDFSNLTANQFYYAAGFNAASGNPALFGQNQGQNQNQATLNANPNCNSSNLQGCTVAGAFVAMAGVTGIANYYNNLNKIAQQNDSGWDALLHGVVAATFFLIAAGVLLYGSFLLFLRAISILVLLITSALAFACFIIPKQSFVEKSWTLWWNSLINVAVFAPVLMIFLFVTTRMAQAFVAANNGLGTLGNMAENPNATTIGALFQYGVVIGLLFAALKVSSKIARAVPGGNSFFNFGRAALSAGVGAFTAGVGGAVIGAFGSRRGAAQQPEVSTNAATVQAGVARTGGASLTNIRQPFQQPTSQQGYQQNISLTGGKIGAPNGPSVSGGFQDQRAQRAAQATAPTPDKVATPAVAPPVSASNGVIKRAVQGAAAGFNASLARSEASSSAPKVEAAGPSGRELQGQYETAQNSLKEANSRREAAEKSLEEARSNLTQARTAKAEENPKEYADLIKEFREATSERDATSNELKSAMTQQLASLPNAIPDAIKQGISEKLNAGALTDSSAEALRKEITQAIQDPDLREKADSGMRAVSERSSVLRNETARIAEAQAAISRKAATDPQIMKAVDDLQKKYAEAFTLKESRLEETSRAEREVARLQGEIASAAASATNIVSLSQRTAAAGAGAISEAQALQATNDATNVIDLDLVKRARAKKQELRIKQAVQDQIKSTDNGGGPEAA